MLVFEPLRHYRTIHAIDTMENFSMLSIPPPPPPRTRCVASSVCLAVGTRTILLSYFVFYTMNNITGSHGNQDPSYIEKPVCCCIFTKHSRSSLLCTPLSLLTVVVRRLHQVCTTAVFLFLCLRHVVLLV